MAKKWRDVASSGAFLALSMEEREEARRQYFESVVAPQVGAEELEDARRQFFSTTSIGEPESAAPVAKDQPQPGFFERAQNFARDAVGAVKGGINAAGDAIGGTFREMVGAEPYQAPTNGLLSGSPDYVAPNPIDVRGAPVRQEVFEQARREAQLTNAQGRQAAAQQPGWRGSVMAKAGAQVQAAKDAGGVAAELGGDVDDKADAYIKQGLAADVARSKATADILAGQKGRLDFVGESHEESATDQAIRRSGDIALAALQIPPTVAKSVADIGRLFSGDAVGVDASEWMSKINERIQEKKSTGAQIQAIEFARIMGDGTAGAPLALKYLLENPGFATELAIPALGSMAVPVGSAKVISAAANHLKWFSKLPAAERAMKVDSLLAATGIGSNAVMNAAGTFVDTDGTLAERYGAAAIAGVGSVAAGRLTGGGAEGAIIRGSQGGVRNLLERGKSAAMAGGREGLQETGEAFSQSAGEQIAETGALDPRQALKQGAVEGVLGAKIGAGVDILQTAGSRPEAGPGLADYQALVRRTFGPAPKVEDQPTTVITPEEILSAPLPQQDQAGSPAAGPGGSRATPAAPNPGAAPVVAGPNPGATGIDLNDPNSVLSTVFGGGAAAGVPPSPAGGSVDAGGVPGAAGVLPGGVEVRGPSGGAADTTGGANSAGLGVGQAPVQAGAPAVGSTNVQQPIPQAARANVHDASSGGGGQAVPGGPADLVAKIQSEWNAGVERATAAGRAADVAGVPRDIRPVSDPELVEPLREVAAAISEATGFADVTGERVVFVESDQMADGLNYQGRAVVNVKGMQKPALFIAGHEISHTWQNLAERGATKARLGQALTQDEADAQRIWAPVEAAIWDMIPESSREAYAYAALPDAILDANGKPRQWSELKNDQGFMRTLRREMAADFHGKRLSDPATVNELARRAPEHFGDYAKKVVSWINSAITKLRGSRGGKLGSNDVDAHIRDLTKAKLIWTDAMISWRKRGGASAAPAVAQSVSQSARSERTSTPEFKAWFGDSRVVDGQGKPLVVYHGTAADVEAFDPSKAGSNYPSTGGQRGFFFTSSPGTASVYAEKPAFAYLNPADPEGADFGDGGSNIMPVYLSLQRPVVVSTKQAADKHFDYNRARLYERADRAGADGIVVRGSDRELYVAFRPEQIKSATGNDGSFDADDANISSSARISPERRKKIDEAAAMAREHVPGYAVDDAVAIVEQYPGAPEMAVPDADRARLEAAIAPLIDKAKALQVGFKAQVEALAARLAGEPKVPGVKALKRAAEKMYQEERDTGQPFSAAWLKDLVRGTIIVQSMDEVPQAIEAVREAFNVTRVKDRFAKPTEAGYRDVLMNVDLGGMPAELQIHIPEMLAAKELGHLLYEVDRSLPPGPEQSMLQEAQSRFYGAAFDAATGAEPAFSRRSPKRDSMDAAGVGPNFDSQASTREKNSSRDTDSSSSSFSSTTPVTADTTLPPGSRSTGSSSLAKNLVPSGNDDKSITGTSDSDTSSDLPIVNLGSQPGGAQRQFDIRTLKEGSLKVLGDVDAIRAALPDDIKGRKIPGGMLFSPSAAPRAKAALEGRKLAYSRAGQVIDKLPMKDGKYVGAPEKFNTPQKIPQLRKILRQLAEEGGPGRFWYENSSKEVLQMVGGDVNEARKFVALLAIYSPQAKVDTNSTFALRAWSQYKAGQPISVKTKVMDDKATAALSDIDAFWSGEKTGNFFNNLLREIDPSVADKQGATIDMWMMRAAQYEGDAPSATQYAFMENENNRIARDLGWEPQQVQAAIWVAMKARTENKGVKKQTEAVSEKRGWIRWAETTAGKPVRVILNAQKHRDNWLKHAMEHDVTKGDTQAAKFDFSDGLRRHIGQISWEARPGRSTGVLPGVNDAPYDQQVEFQQAVQKALYSEEGADLLAQQLGLLVDGPDILAPGVWQGEIAAGMQKQVAMAPGKGEDGKSIDPSQKKALDLYAATLGLLLRQEGVGWHRPFYKGKRSEENGIELQVGRPFTPDEAQALWGATDKAMRDAGVADWEQRAGLISSPKGIRLVNFGAVDNNAKFRDLIEEKVVPTLPFDEVESVDFSSDGNLVTNDWKEAPRGQAYQEGIREAGRPDLLRWSRDVLAPRIQAVFDEFSGKYGWGDPGRVDDLFDEPSLSRRPDAAGDRRDRGVPEGSEQGSPTYGVATPGAAAPVEAIHFSQQQRASLSSAAYGSGLRGAEMERVMRSSDTRLSQRVYFYVNQGTGIRPESGVGAHAHSVTLANLYDTAKGEIKGAGNDFESAVLDAGYDGYLVRLPGSQSGQAVLLGAHNVPVQYLGLGAPEKTQPAPASQAPEASSTRSGGELVSRKALDVQAIRGLASVQAVAPSFRFEFGKARVKADEVDLANAALEQLGSELSFSRRGALVSPQSTLDAAIERSTRVLEDAIQRGGQVAGLGRTSHVLGMLKGVAVPLAIDGPVVRKVFIEKHAGKLDGIPAGDIVRGLYRPAMVFQQKGKPNEYELVLPVVTKQGPLTAAILVDGDRAVVKSVYPRSWNNPESGPGLRKWMANQADSKPVYADEYLALIAATGNEDARAQAGIREKAGSPGDQRPGVADLGASARQTSPAQTPAGSGSASVARPGAPVNEHFIGWRDYRALAAKFGRLPGEQDLLRWIGDNYKGDPTDAPSFSARQPTLWRDELGRLRSPTGKLAAYYGGILNTWLAKVGMNYMSPELKRQFREMKIQLQKAQDVTIAVARESFKMSEAERELVSDIIEGELKTGVVPPSHAVQMAMGMQAVLGQQTDELVALGMLNKESADLWRGKYLPRFYKPKLTDIKDAWSKALQQLVGRKPIMAGIQGKRLKSRGLWETVTHKSLPEWEALGWQVRDPDYDPATATARTEVQIWRDFTREEREKMGEIRDAGFRFAMGYQQAQRDIAYGKLFKGIAEKIAKKHERPGYVQVPDSTVEGTGVKRYGALAGMWVPLEVLQHLKAMDSGAGPAMQMYRKAMSMWKEGKVVLNPVSHANNVLSNISLAHFAGVSYWDLHKYAAAAKDLATSSGFYQEAKDAGLMLGTMGQEELMNMLPPELQALVHQQRSTAGKVVEGAFNALTFSWTRNGEQKGLRKYMAKAYEAEDVFFRYMIYADGRKRGLTPSEAVDHSQRYIFTYDDLPVSAQKIRDFGLPFFAYTYKVIPALLHTAANYPHRFLAPAAALYGLNAAMYALAAGDDDEEWLEKLRKGATDPERQAQMEAMETEERENLPPWMKGFVTIGAKKAIRLGTDEVLGLPVFWDVGQIMPGGNLFDMQNNTGGVALPQSLTVSHPLFTTMAAMLYNRDSFFGKDIVDKTDDSSEAALKRTEWMWRQYAPAISFGNYHWERALNILAQQTGEPVSYWPWRDLTGVDKQGMPIEPGYTALQTVGIKVRPVDIERSAEMRDGQNKALMRDIDKELRNFKRMNQAGYMSDANLEREIERARLKKERLREGLTIDGEER